MEVLKTKHKRQIRWPPTIIKWCCTLRDYSHFIKPGVGFLPEVSAQMIKEANIQEDKDRYVVLTWDEMKIKGDLCFDKHTCELIGFTTNIGEINNSQDQYEQYCKNPSSSTRSVASHMLVFLVRGIFTSLEFAYALFPTTGITAAALFPLVWDAVYHLESSGFRVVAFACDGAAPNRKFFFKCMEAQGNLPTRHLISSVMTQDLKYTFSLMFPITQDNP